MKKQLLLIATLFAFSVQLFSQSIRITTVVDQECPTGETSLRFAEVYVDGTVDVSDLKFESQFSFATNWVAPISLGTGNLTDTFFYIVNDEAAFNVEFPGVLTPTTTAVGNVLSSVGGGAKYRISDGSNATVDVFGIDGQNGEMTTWNFDRSYVQRNDGLGPNATFVESNWTIEPQATLNFEGVCWMASPLNSIVTLGKYMTAPLSTDDVNGSFGKDTKISNPVLAGEALKINTNVSFDKVSVFELNGRHIEEVQIRDNEIKMNQNISSGMYLLKFQKGNTSFSKKLIIK